jgi:hypothetical protein
MYIDYRQLNTIIIKNRYILPLIYEIQNRIKKIKIFTKLDLKKGYYKIKIKNEKKMKNGLRI